VTRHLTVSEVLRIAVKATGAEVLVRDPGLLDAAVHRPQATVFGEDAYPDLFSKAAALLHSLATSHPFIDGNKRIAWVSARAMFALNGTDLRHYTEDEAYDFVIAVATGELDDVAKIAERLRTFAG